MPDSLIKTSVTDTENPITHAGLKACASFIVHNKVPVFVEALQQQLPGETIEAVTTLAHAYLETLQKTDTADTKVFIPPHARAALLQCLPQCVNDVSQAMAIVQELDAHTVSTAEDILSESPTLAHLQQTEDGYRQAQTMARIGNWTWDILQNSIFWTEELYRIYGQDPQQEPMTYERFLSLLTPEDAALLQEKVTRCVTEHIPYEITQKFTLPNGDIKYIHSIGDVLKDDQGNAVKLMGTSQDITAQKLIEEQLRTSQDFIKKLMDVSPSGITSYDVRTGQYTFINKAIEKLLGYSVDEPLAKGVSFFMELVHPDDLPGLIEKNTAAMQKAAITPDEENEVINEFKYRMRHKNGSYRWFHTYATVFDRDEKGRLSHVLNVSVDVTEQEAAEQELSQKNLELHQSNASLEEYAYVASHDLKEPLRKISMFADKLAYTNKNTLSEESGLYLEKIRNAATRMQTMINDLLAVSTITGNKDFEQQGLNDIIAHVQQNLEVKITQSGATITADELPTHPVVISQFRQLFQNLISNGLKFAKADTPPQINISHRYLQPAELTHPQPLKAPRYLELTIADNGIGFENEFAADIFNMFKRLHSRSAYEGTGIGLAICKKVVENHNGTIHASGEPGRGAQFTIILPVL